MDPIMEGNVAEQSNDKNDDLTRTTKQDPDTYRFKSIFDCPLLLQGINLAAYEVDKSKKPAENKDDSPREKGEAVVSDRMACSVCGGIAFESRQDQTQHYKSDWHRFNLKQRIKGAAPVSVESFEEAVAGDISSISGSDSESEDDSDDDFKKLRLPSKHREQENKSDDEEEESYHIEGIGRRHPRVFFRNADDELVSVYRCVIHGKKNTPENGEELVTMATKLPEEMLWIVILLAGGHFAAGVFKGGEVIARKTFHRYVVRAKRGTVQSSRDSQGNAPKSAGANIRREQEKQLTQDIHSLLESWSEHMSACHRIFLRASGSGRQIFHSGKTPLLNKSDPRVRMVPFPTRRPTHRELLRVHSQLAGVQIHGKHLGITDFISVSPKKSKPPTSPHGSPRRSRAKQPEVKVSSEADDKSSSNGNTSVDQTDLKQSEETKKPQKRKEKKKDQPKRQQSPDSEPIDEELNHIRNALYTACKIGNLAQLESLLANLDPKNLNHTADQSKPTDPFNQSESVTQCATENSGQSNAQTIETGQSDALTAETNQSEASKGKELDQLDQSESLDTVESKGAKNPSSISTSIKDTSKFVLVDILNMPFGENNTTLLHVVAKESQKNLVSVLMETGADPCSKEKGGATPYMAASNKETRNEFRRFMARFPDRYDYARAQIPGPLTDAMEAEKKMKDAEKKKQQKKAKKERQKEQKAQDAVVRAEEEEKRRYMALSDREKRALAAEKRLMAQYKDKGEAVPAISRCFECAKDMTGKIPFEYSDNKFCSPPCMKQHRLKAKKT